MSSASSPPRIPSLGPLTAGWKTPSMRPRMSRGTARAARSSCPQRFFMLIPGGSMAGRDCAWRARRSGHGPWAREKSRSGEEEVLQLPGDATGCAVHVDQPCPGWPVLELQAVPKQMAADEESARPCARGLQEMCVVWARPAGCSLPCVLQVRLEQGNPPRAHVVSA